MAKRIPLHAGDVFLIPLSKTQAVLGKLLYIYEKGFKGTLMIGVALEPLVDPRKKKHEAEVAAWGLVIFSSRSAVDKGHWTIVGHDPSKIAPSATRYRMGGGLFQAEELVRDETAADRKRYPVQSIGGYLAGEIHIRAVLDMPQPPLPWELPKAKAKVVKGTLKEDRFWSLIDDAWTKAAPRLAKQRAKVTEKNAEALSAAFDDVLPVLEKALGKLSRDELIGFDRHLERSLYELDRAKVQEHTDGSDDGFLYARGFIVGVGRAYYDLVRKDPAKAIGDMEEERLTYLPHRVFEERFDEDLPPSEISRETGSNKAGWKA
jgi:hypothetical protein